MRAVERNGLVDRWLYPVLTCSYLLFSRVYLKAIFDVSGIYTACSLSHPHLKRSSMSILFFHVRLRLTFLYTRFGKGAQKDFSRHDIHDLLASGLRLDYHFSKTS